MKKIAKVTPTHFLLHMGRTTLVCSVHVYVPGQTTKAARRYFTEEYSVNEIAKAIYDEFDVDEVQVQLAILLPVMNDDAELPF